MLYQFNNLSGRLTGTQNPHALYPITPVPLSKNDPPKIEYANAKIVQVAERQMSSSKVISGAVPEKLRAKMELFQIKNGVPVFLKGGPMDKALFGLTVGLCAVGLGLAVKTMYDLSFPKKA